MEIKNPFRNKVRCCFCDETRGFLHSVHDWGMYKTELGRRIFYHPGCLGVVTCEPEFSGSINVDKALNILNLLPSNQTFNENIVFSNKEKFKKLKDICEASNGKSES